MKNSRIQFLNVLRKYARLLNPEPKIGGLEVTDVAVRFLMPHGEGETFTVSLRLPPGTVARGRVADPNQLARALRDIRARISRAKRPAPVVLVLPAEIVYLRAFSLPAFVGERLADAATLNLEMLSPLPIAQVYASWQRIGEHADAESQIELLAAFAERAVVDVYVASLVAAGFTPVAIEFPALALGRLIAAEGAGLDAGASHLVIHVANDGVGVTILRHLHLSFHHFTSWQEIREIAGSRELTLGDVTAFFEREIQRFLNFYTSRWGSAVSTVLLVSQELGDAFRDAIASRFPLRVVPLELRKFAELPPLWFPVLGAAARGAIPRSRDTFISLGSESAQAQYESERAFAFAGLWRMVLVTLASFFLIAFLAVDSFVAREEVRVQARLAAEPPPADAARLAALEAEARSFNQLAGKALRARELSTPHSPLFELVQSLMGRDASLRRITVRDGRTTITGIAASSDAAVALRNRFLRETQLADLAFPLGDIKENPDGTASWSVVFRWAASPGPPPSAPFAPGLPLPR